VADPLLPHPCEVANSVSVFRELSWLTGGMAKVEWDCKAAGLRSAPPAKTPHSHRPSSHNLHHDDYVGAGSFCTS
jgi:hypothetical protein